MEYDFGIIAREFMQHHFGRLKEFNDLAVYGNDKPEQSNPEKSIQNKVLNIMYNAAKSGDRYSVEMMKCLYKTYHKKEYKQLKSNDNNLYYRALGFIVLCYCVLIYFSCDYCR